MVTKRTIQRDNNLSATTINNKNKGKEKKKKKKMPRMEVSVNLFLNHLRHEAFVVLKNTSNTCLASGYLFFYSIYEYYFGYIDMFNKNIRIHEYTICIMFRQTFSHKSIVNIKDSSQKAKAVGLFVRGRLFKCNATA